MHPPFPPLSYASLCVCYVSYKQPTPRPSALYPNEHTPQLGLPEASTTVHPSALYEEVFFSRLLAATTNHSATPVFPLRARLFFLRPLEATLSDHETFVADKMSTGCGAYDRRVPLKVGNKCMAYIASRKEHRQIYTAFPCRIGISERKPHVHSCNAFAVFLLPL